MHRSVIPKIFILVKSLPSLLGSLKGLLKQVVRTTAYYRPQCDCSQIWGLTSSIMHGPVEQTVRNSFEVLNHNKMLVP